MSQNFESLGVCPEILAALQARGYETPTPIQAGSIPHLLFMAYQGTFAIITAALISGAVVERMRFMPYLGFIAGWTLLVYAPVCHWVWGGGWLAELVAEGNLPALR